MTAWVANTYTATCSCGYAGRVRLTSQLANADLIAHHKTHKGTK